MVPRENKSNIEGQTKSIMVLLKVADNSNNNSNDDDYI